MRQLVRWLKRSQSGQSATEYMLVVAVIVLALVAAASRLITPFEAGVNALGAYVQTVLGTTPTMTTPASGGT